MATENVEEKQKTFLEKLAKVNERFVGPYFLGESYSYIDVVLFPFFERIQLLFPHFKKLDIFENYARLQEWYNLVGNREAVKITSTRSELGINSHIYPGDSREEYIRAVYYTYHTGKMGASRPVFSKLPLQRLTSEEYYKLVDNL